MQDQQDSVTFERLIAEGILNRNDFSGTMKEFSCHISNYRWNDPDHDVKKLIEEVEDSINDKLPKNLKQERRSLWHKIFEIVAELLVISAVLGIASYALGTVIFNSLKTAEIFGACLGIAAGIAYLLVNMQGYRKDLKAISGVMDGTKKEIDCDQKFLVYVKDLYEMWMKKEKSQSMQNDPLATQKQETQSVAEEVQSVGLPLREEPGESDSFGLEDILTE